jgi:hypothetical protein
MQQQPLQHMSTAQLSSTQVSDAGYSLELDMVALDSEIASLEESLQAAAARMH